jgi:hypothetical protein
MLSRKFDRRSNATDRSAKHRTKQWSQIISTDAGITIVAKEVEENAEDPKQDNLTTGSNLTEQRQEESNSRSVEEKPEVVLKFAAKC